MVKLFIDKTTAQIIIFMDPKICNYLEGLINGWY